MKTTIKYLTVVALLFLIASSCKKDDKILNVIADFSMPDTIINQNSSLTLVDKSEGEPTAWLWEIEGGDPAITNARYPTITFNRAGTHTISLTVSNPNSISKASKEITVLPLDNLFLHFPLNGNAEDISGNENHGIIYEAKYCPDRFNNANSALLFDGIDDRLSFPYSNSNNNPVSFSFWINFSKLNPAILGTNISDSIQSGVWFSVGTTFETRNKLAINIGNGQRTNPSSRRTLIADKELNTNTWYHIIGIVESATKMRLFIDGQEYRDNYSGYATSIIYSEGNGTIGHVWDPTQYFSGKIDNFKIFNSILSEKEIQALLSEK